MPLSERLKNEFVSYIQSHATRPPEPKPSPDIDLGPGWSFLPAYDAAKRFLDEAEPDWTVMWRVAEALRDGHLVGIAREDGQWWICGPHEAEAISRSEHPESGCLNYG